MAFCLSTLNPEINNDFTPIGHAPVQETQVTVTEVSGTHSGVMLWCWKMPSPVNSQYYCHLRLPGVTTSYCDHTLPAVAHTVVALSILFSFKCLMMWLSV